MQGVCDDFSVIILIYPHQMRRGGDVVCSVDLRRVGIYQKYVLLAAASREPSLLQLVDVLEKIIPEGIVACGVKQENFPGLSCVSAVVFRFVNRAASERYRHQHQSGNDIYYKYIYSFHQYSV